MIRLDPSQPHEFHSRKAVKRAELAFQAGKRPSEQRRREDAVYEVTQFMFYCRKPQDGAQSLVFCLQIVTK